MDRMKGLIYNGFSDFNHSYDNRVGVCCYSKQFFFSTKEYSQYFRPGHFFSRHGLCVGIL